MKHVRWFAIGFAATVIAFFFVDHAFALTLTPPGDEPSGFLGSNTISLLTTTDGWLSVESPLEGECYVGYGNPGFNWGIGSIGTIGASGSLATYLDGTGAHGTDCTPGSTGITDWFADGIWVVRIYSDDTFTTVNESVSFLQGSTSSPPIVGGGATSTVEQAQTNLYYAFVLFYISMFGMIWLMRKH